MDYTKEILLAVQQIENATGKNRGDISVELGYNPTYISTVLKKGGNKKILNKIRETYANILQPKAMPDGVNEYDQALLHAILADYIKFKSSVTKRSVEDIAAEIDQNTRIALLNIGKK